MTAEPTIASMQKLVFNAESVKDIDTLEQQDFETYGAILIIGAINWWILH